MSNFNNKSITNKGLELLSAAMAGGKLEFTRIVMGSGTYSGDIGMIESLVDQKQSLDIKSITRKGSQVILSTALVQSAIIQDFYWKEIGVYARGNDGLEILYLYGSAEDTSFISKEMLNEKMINVGVVVSNVQNVSAVINGSLVYLSREDLEQHNNDSEAHQAIRNWVSNLMQTEEEARVLGDLELSTQIKNLEGQILNIDVPGDVRQVINERVNADTSKPLSRLISEWINAVKTAILNAVSNLTTHVTSQHTDTKNHVTLKVDALPQKSVWTDDRGAKLDNLNQSMSTTQSNITSAINSARDNINANVNNKPSKMKLSAIQNVTHSGPAAGQSIFSYSNAKGGKVRINSRNYSALYNLVVDNVTLGTDISSEYLFRVVTDGTPHGAVLEIYFKSGFSLSYGSTKPAYSGTYGYTFHIYLYD